MLPKSVLLLLLFLLLLSGCGVSDLAWGGNALKTNPFFLIFDACFCKMTSIDTFGILIVHF